MDNIENWKLNKNQDWRKNRENGQKSKTKKNP